MRTLKNIPIFISSTFKDMDFERDIIKFKVIPRLNVKYHNMGLAFQAIDLRIGVNTSNLSEEERENKVLNVCLNCIDEARPFFIGLLGDRYGWIPTDKRFKYILNRLSEDKRPLISGAVNRSVTELEILYGAIGSEGEYLENSLFFFRNNDSYWNMDSGSYNEFTDSDIEHSEHLQILKRKISDITANTPFEPISYSLQWNAQTGRFTDPQDKFVTIVFENICRLIDKSLQLKTNETCEEWHAILNENDERVIDSYLKIASPRLHTVEKICKRLVSGERIIMIGENGTGKSTFISLVNNYLKNFSDKVVVLKLFVGTNVQSFSVATTLKKWINTICSKYSKEIPFVKEMDTDDSSISNLKDYLVRLAYETNIRPLILIDDVDLLESYDTESSFLSWIPDNFPLLATSSKDDTNAIKIYHDIQSENLPKLNNDDINRYLDNWESHNSNELGSELRDLIIERSTTPRHVGFMLKLIESLSSTDFINIRNTIFDDDMSKINNYLIGLIQSAPIKSGDFINELLLKITTEYTSQEKLKQAIDLVSLSPFGLRDSDIEAILGVNFNLLDYATITNLLENIFYFENVSHRRMFKSRTLAQQYASEIKNAKNAYSTLTDYFASLDGADPLRRDLLLYFTLLCENKKILIENCLFTPFDKSSESDAIDYYCISIHNLLNFNDRIVEIISKAAYLLETSDRIIFLYNIFFRGFPLLSDRLNIIRKFKGLIFGIDKSKIKTALHAYTLAWIQDEFINSVKYDENTTAGDLIVMYSSSLSLFELANEIDATIYDSANMIIATAGQLITLYAQTGDYQSMDTIITKHLSSK